MNYKAKALKEWSRIIREVGECEICGKKGVKGETQGWTNLVAHHLIRKGQALDYLVDLSNGLCLCYYCHKRNPDISPHLNEENFFRWLEKFRPGQFQWFDEHNPLCVEKEVGGLKMMCRKVVKTTDKIDWQAQYEMLKEL